MATQTVAYFSWNPLTPAFPWTRDKIQVQDDTYGIAGKSVNSGPNTLGMLDEDGKLLHLDKLHQKMLLPIWGPNKDQLFADLIPVFPVSVPATITSSLWQEFAFDPDDPTTYPQTECPPGASFFPELNGIKGWECQHKRYPNLHYQNVHWMGAESVNVWRVMEVSTYRRQKETFDNPIIPNPQYPIVEAQRAEAGIAYENLIRSTFFPVGYYQFQSLPLNGGYGDKVYKWYISGVNDDKHFDPIPGHKLAAVVTGGSGSPFIHRPAPMRNPEMHYYRTSAGNYWKDLYESVYKSKSDSSTWNITKEMKMVFLTK